MPRMRLHSCTIRIALATSIALVGFGAATPAQHRSASDTPALAHAVGYYDTRLNRVVLIGDSVDPAEGAKDRMWSWTGSRWEPMAIDGPIGRVNATAAYLRRRNVAVVAGGARKAGERWGTHGDAWIGDAEGWRNTADISPRDHHALVETQDGGVLLFGGIPAQRSAA